MATQVVVAIGQAAPVARLRSSRSAAAAAPSRSAPLAARVAVRGVALECKQSASVACRAERSGAVVTVCGALEAGIGLLGNKAGSE